MEVILNNVKYAKKKFKLVMDVKLKIYFYGIFTIVLFVKNVKIFFIEHVYNQKINVLHVYQLKKVIN